MKKILTLILLLTFLTSPLKNVNAGNNLGQNLKGRLLLAVQQKGAIYFVDDKNYQKHLIKWDNALPIFQQFALGITDEDLLKIPVTLETIRENLDSDGDGYSDRLELEHGYSPYISGDYKGKFIIDQSFANRLKNKFLLQVNQGGAIWYVNENGIRFNVRWDNLRPLFESLALGITDEDLGRIENTDIDTNKENVDYMSLLLKDDEIYDIVFGDFELGLDLYFRNKFKEIYYITKSKDKNLSDISEYVKLVDDNNMNANFYFRGISLDESLYNEEETENLEKLIPDGTTFNLPFSFVIEFDSKIDADKIYNLFVDKEKNKIDNSEIKNIGSYEMVDNLGEEAIIFYNKFFIDAALLVVKKNNLMIFDFVMFGDEINQDFFINKVVEKQREKINNLGL